MPRPRSSTFYLPLAPVDAPLSLKAKLSVLPPSAANALLAPRSTHAQPPQPSAAAAAPTCNPSGSPSASEDECARLERVLGLSSHVGNRRTARRHTDAPLPQIRADFASSQQPTLPSGSCAPLPPQQQPFEVATTLPPSSPPTPALSQSSSLDSCGSSDGMDMDMDASTFAITDPASSRSLEKPAHGQHIDFTPADNERAPVQRRLSASAPLTQMMVTVEQLSAGHSGLQATETTTTPSAPGLTKSEGMEVPTDAFAPAQSTRITVETCQGRPFRAAGLPLPRPKSMSMADPIVESSTISKLPCGFSKVWACKPTVPSQLSCSITRSNDPASPSVLTDHSESSRRSSSSSSFSLYNFPSSGSLHVFDARHLLPRQFRMPYPPPPPPCALPSAIDSTPDVSGFISSPVNKFNPSESPSPSDPGSASSTSNLVSTSSAPSSHSVQQPTTTNDTTLVEKSHLDMDEDEDEDDEDLEIDPDEELDNEASVSIPCTTQPAEDTASAVANTLTPPSTPQPPCTSASHPSQLSSSTLYPQQHASYPHFTQSTRPTPPPRQRFRLAPVYLTKLLRRSLGQTAWEREETVRIAKAVEKRHGFALVSKAMGGHCREADRWEEEYVGYEGSRCEGLYDSTKRSSIVWCGYDDMVEDGNGDVFAANGDYSGVLPIGQVAEGRRFVEGEWVEEVFSDGSYSGWDLDLENECAVEGEDDADVPMDHEEDVEVSGGSNAFVREGAPEPEDRRPLFQGSEENGLLQVPNARWSVAGAQAIEEDTRSPSPDGYGGYAMVGRFTWDSDWPSSPVSPLRTTAPTTTTLVYRDPPATPYHPVLSASSSDSTYTPSSLLPPFSHTNQAEGEEEENIFRYSPMQLPQEDSVSIEGHQEEEPFRYSPLDEEDHSEGEMDVDVVSHKSMRGYHHENSYRDRPFLLSTTASSSTDSIPISLSPSFPPGPLVGTKISSEDGISECGTITDEEEEDERFYELDGDASMADDLNGAAADEKEFTEGQEVSYVPAQGAFDSSPAAGVFIIPPSPLGTFSFDATPSQSLHHYGGVGGIGSTPDVPTSPISPTWTHVHSSPIQHFSPQSAYQPSIPSSYPAPLPSSTVSVSPEHTPRRSIERFRLARSSMERIRPARRSMEWIKPSSSVISPSSAASSQSSPHGYDPREANGGPVLVAPRPRRASRALENVFSRQSPVLKTSSLPPVSSPPLLHPVPTNRPPSTITGDSESPSISPLPTRPSPAAWTFGSLKSALSSSVSHIVELARSRSPSPLPWLMRPFNNTSPHSSEPHGTISSISSVLLPSSHQPHVPPSDKEELEAERSSCVTPTPASRSRSASTITITESNIKRSAPVPQLHLDTSDSSVGQPFSTAAAMNEMDVGMGMSASSSPPPKRTLSTSSLSSLESEPESESGSSGGVFSRSPSPEPNSERGHDPSYSLTPRSRPISADAKAAAACGGRLSPMMIPGSWDPNELWDDDLGMSRA